MSSVVVLSHLGMVLVNLFFSGWHVLGKVALDDGTNPIIFAVYREASATILMAVMFLILKKSGSQAYADVHFGSVSKADLPRFIFLGFCSFCNVVGFVIALSMTSAANAACLQPSIPVFACLLGMVFRLETVTRYKGLGVLLGTAGSIVVAIFESKSEGASAASHSEAEVLVGNGILVVQCFATACLIVFQKPLTNRYPSVLLTFYYYSIGSVLTLLASLRYVLEPEVWVITGWPSYAALAYAAVFSTAFNYCIIAFAVKHINSTITSLYSAFQPVWTVILSVIFLSLSINLQEVGGAALVMLGLFVTIYAQRKDAADQLQLQEQQEAAFVGVDDVDGIGKPLLAK